jgi:hypothetical protein
LDAARPDEDKEKDRQSGAEHEHMVADENFNRSNEQTDKSGKEYGEHDELNHKNSNRYK